jgi:hypothetical protein
MLEITMIKRLHSKESGLHDIIAQFSIDIQDCSLFQIIAKQRLSRHFDDPQRQVPALKSLCKSFVISPPNMYRDAGTLRPWRS